MTKKEIEAFLKAKGIEVLRWEKTKVALAGGMIITRKKLTEMVEKTTGKDSGLNQKPVSLPLRSTYP